jgi:hypothetical protein
MGPTAQEKASRPRFGPLKEGDQLRPWSISTTSWRRPFFPLTPVGSGSKETFRARLNGNRAPQTAPNLGGGHDRRQSRSSQIGGQAGPATPRA